MCARINACTHFARVQISPPPRHLHVQRSLAGAHALALVWIWRITQAAFAPTAFLTPELVRQIVVHGRRVRAILGRKSRDIQNRMMVAARPVAVRCQRHAVVDQSAKGPDAHGNKIGTLRVAGKRKKILSGLLLGLLIPILGVLSTYQQRVDADASGSTQAGIKTMTAVSAQISKFIDAANALGAPLFGLDLLASAASAAEAKRGSIIAEFEANPPSFDAAAPFAHFLTPTDEIDADIADLEKAASAAWAFVASRHLPASIGAPLTTATLEGVGEEINDTLRHGYDVAKRYIG
ncbi:hypothetical protein [Pusillimonas noertemannii]|uniref:hypothetical protein n=1 Tax=Pusillimonas noertemannii TaxID=305977 RepID=UPI00333FA13D